MLSVTPAVVCQEWCNMATRASGFCESAACAPPRRIRASNCPHCGRPPPPGRPWRGWLDRRSPAALAVRPRAGFRAHAEDGVDCVLDTALPCGGGKLERNCIEHGLMAIAHPQIDRL